MNPKFIKLLVHITNLMRFTVTKYELVIITKIVTQHLLQNQQTVEVYNFYIYLFSKLNSSYIKF